MFDTPLCFKRQSHGGDEEFVERARRGVASHDRWRRWLRMFAVALVLCAIGLVVYAQHVVNNFGNLFPGVPQGFIVGLVIGVQTAIIFVGVVHFLVIAFFVDVRALRLLVRYHDALDELRRVSNVAVVEKGT